jgi:predicted dehydrogenase
VSGSGTLRVGIVGAGRTRQGLGPYLARAFEQNGARVTAVAGRDRASGARAAVQLATGLGHAVGAADDAHALAREVDLLVIAAPVPAHLDGLDAALQANVPCLCEKPLVDAADAAAGLQRIAAFRERRLLLAENCQWPFTLDALRALHPHVGTRPVRRVAMGLSPAWPGRTMIVDSLSHVLSVVQALAPLPPDCTPHDVRQTNAAADAPANEVRFVLPAATGAIDVTLHLAVCPQQPRPAWLAVDGARADRRIGVGYELSFVAPDGRAVILRDPLQALVYGLCADLAAAHERTRSLADAVELRLRLYAAVLTALDAGRSR